MTNFNLISEELTLQFQDEIITLQLAAQGIQGPSGSGGSNPAYPVAESISALRVCALNASNLLVLADCTNPDHAFRLVGLQQTAVSVGSATPLVSGIVSDSNWAWDGSRPIWLGSLGFLTQVPPASGFLVQVATPLTPTTIHFEIQETTVL